MNYEMREINKTLLVSWLSIIGILAGTYAIEVYIRERSVQYYTAFMAVMIIPWIIVYGIYTRKKDSKTLGYLVVVGYSIMYAFVTFTGSTQMVSNYILPLLCFLILYHEPLLILVTFGIAVCINAIAFAYQFQNNMIVISNLKETEIRFASIIICFAGGYVSAKLYNRIKNERDTRMHEAMRADAANEAKGEFLAHMSHEIRTPINAVLGMDTMILREAKDSKIKEYAMDIQKAGQALLAIINDILDLSKIESGKMEIVPVDYDFSSLVNDTVNLVRDKASAKDLQLNVDVDSDIPCTLHGDDVRLRQVLVNILSNGVKYTEKGSVTLAIHGKKLGNIERLHFSVKDTGIGIKESDLEKIFSQFERVDELRNRHIEGTGLGMSITLNLLSMMKSSLEVKSEYGVGSEFYFDLDQIIVSDEPIGDISSRIAQFAADYSYAVSFTAPDANVLVVDDNLTNLTVFGNLLKETQVAVTTSSSGIDALELIKDNHYDIIFLDHMMPDMDGIEVMHEIVTNDDHANVGTPVIVLTANAIVGAKEKYMSAGFTDYISKPINPDKLEKMIADYLPPEKIHIGEARISEVPEVNEVELPTIEGVDWEYAHMHLRSTDAVLTTVKTVYDAIELDARELSEYYDRIVANNDDYDTINSFRIKIHSIKSSANILGFLPIAGMAATLEYAARDGKVQKIIDMTPHFIADFRAYRNKLADALQLETSTEKEEITDKSIVIDYINLLIESVGAFDIHGADLALEKIKSYKYNKEVDEIIDNISGAVSNIDIEKVELWGNDLIQAVTAM